jgi:hypothetical protein
MFGVLNSSVSTLVEKAKSNIPVHIDGEEYIIINMVVASDSFATKARVMLASVSNPFKQFEVSLSAVDLSFKKD